MRQELVRLELSASYKPASVVYRLNLWSCNFIAQKPGVQQSDEPTNMALSHLLSILIKNIYTLFVYMYA